MSRRERSVQRLESVRVEEMTCDGSACTPTNVIVMEMHEQPRPGWGILHVRVMNEDNTHASLDVAHFCPICIAAMKRIGPPKTVPGQPPVLP